MMNNLHAMGSKKSGAICDWLRHRQIWAHKRHTLMKTVYILGCMLLLSGFGCKPEARPAQSAPPESKIISDGTSTWVLGAAIMNGTNVPLSNITVRAITNQAPK